MISHLYSLEFSHETQGSYYPSWSIWCVLMVRRPNESHSVENDNIPGHLGKYHCCWCCDSLHHQAIDTSDIIYAGESIPCCWKILIFVCNFSMAIGTGMIMSYFGDFNFILKFVVIKNISLGYTWWVQRIFSEYCDCWCASASSPMPNIDQDQMDPLWISGLTVFQLYSHGSGVNIVNLVDLRQRDVANAHMWLGQWICEVFPWPQFIF